MKVSKNYPCKNCGRLRGEHRAYVFYCPSKPGLGFDNKCKYDPDYSAKPVNKKVIP